MMRRFFFLFLVAVLATVVLRTLVIEGIYVASASMEPTLPVGTKYFLEKLTVRLSGAKRADIVVFPSPVEPGKDLIKRVIAVGGDKIELRNKEVYLDGLKLEESYVRHSRRNEVLEDDNVGPLEVAEGTVFVMGDNRDESGDSRDWKNIETGEHIYFIPVKSLKGKIILLF